MGIEDGSVVKDTCCSSRESKECRWRTYTRGGGTAVHIKLNESKEEYSVNYTPRSLRLPKLTAVGIDMTSTTWRKEGAVHTDLPLLEYLGSVLLNHLRDITKNNHQWWTFPLWQSLS